MSMADVAILASEVTGVRALAYVICVISYAHVCSSMQHTVAVVIVNIKNINNTVAT